MVSAVIIQARMNSTRLPGKVLMELAGRTVLDHVISRCLSIEAADRVCIATTDNSRDDCIADLAKKLGVHVYRGSENDVLSRYHAAAHELGATDVLRVTSDCPLIDPQVCSAVIRLRQQTGCDYACNFSPASFPHGLDCEAFSMAALNRAQQNSTSAFEREHVTVWLIESDGITRRNLENPGQNQSSHRWTLDTPRDYAFLSRLFAGLTQDPTRMAWQDILAFIEGRPDLLANSLLTDASFSP